MQYIILFFFFGLSYASEAPVFTIDDLNSTEYVLDDGLVVNNAVHFQRIINGKTWTNVESTGIAFTFSSDKDGNIEFTWDDILYNDDIKDSFVVFYKNPKLGLQWNPDGVEIRIEELNVKSKDLDGEFTTDVYGFYIKGILSTRAWVSRESGIVRVTRIINGTERSLVRRKKIR